MGKLICKSKGNGNYPLTINNEYEVLIDEENYIFVKNDNNKAARYSKKLFKEAEPEVIPEPRTEQDCIDSIEYDDKNISYINLENEEVNFDIDFESNGLEISCGIRQITGINLAIDTINKNVNIENDDMIDLRKALFKQSLKGYIKSEGGAAMTILSTNLTNVNNVEIEIDEDLLQVLNDYAHLSTETVTNDQSGNKIKMWIFYTYMM